MLTTCVKVSRGLLVTGGVLVALVLAALAL